MIQTSTSVEQTEAIAGKLARRLRGGECVAIDGEMGAGKTQFVRGIVRGVGGDTHGVSSPTYVLLNVYNTGRLTVYHLDAYRVGGAEDFEAIGFPELLDQGGVVVVEWAARVLSLLPPKRIDVRIEAIDPITRRITISGMSDRNS